MTKFLRLLAVGVAAIVLPTELSAAEAPNGGAYSVSLTVTSELVCTNTPMDPTIDFATLIRDNGLPGILDPNSIRVVDVAAEQETPCAINEDFAYADKGRVEWVIQDPTHKEFEIRFRAVEKRPPLQPAAFTPMIGVGDLLRYNAGTPRPVALPYISALVDLTGDGKQDLVGCWNYAYRPGWPWDGIICHPRTGDETALQFGDLVRVRYVDQTDPIDRTDPADSARAPTAQGDPAEAGNAGAQGEPGAQGDPAEAGNAGAQGEPTAQGDPAEAGNAGAQGAPTAQGDPAEAGNAEAQGAPTAQGNSSDPSDQSDPSDSPPTPLDLKFFSSIYMTADFADFNRDGLVDLVYSPRAGNSISLYLNTGKRDTGGMPVFVAAGSLPRPASAWGPVRAIDLNGDGAMDLVACAIYGEDSTKTHESFYLRNTNANGWPVEPAEPVDLGAGKGPCFFDVDKDGLLDAVSLCEVPNGGVAEDRIVWRHNLGGDPPSFGEQANVAGIDAFYPSGLAAVNDGPRRGLLVQHDVFQVVSFYEHAPAADNPAMFGHANRLESVSAVMALSDQAWPCICDWDGDGDPDLLIGGGYGWPRIVLNEGTKGKPAFAEPQFILSEGKPIKIVRNDVLGEPLHWHNMGYSYPVYEDWDGDGLPDLIVPNETNRIFWYKNAGTRTAPAFGPQQQLIVDGYPDLPESRKRSAERAVDAVYPLEDEQPFFWRTGAAVADWNGDGLMDLATHDGATRKLTLFAQYRDEHGVLRLKKAGPMELADGRLIDDAIVQRSAHWTESFRPVDWDGDGVTDIVYACGGTEDAKGSIYLLRNVGTKQEPLFDAPRTMCCYGWPIKVTAHGPNPWPGDLDGDGKPDLLTCVEWSVYPFFTHAAIEMTERPAYELGTVRAE